MAVADAPDGLSALLIETWLIYERHDRMEDAAAEAGVPLSTFKRRLHLLYRELGVGSSQRAGRMLRESGLLPPPTPVCYHLIPDPG